MTVWRPAGRSPAIPAMVYPAVNNDLSGRKHYMGFPAVS